MHDRGELLDEEEVEKPVENSIQHCLKTQDKIIAELASSLEALASRIEPALTPTSVGPEPDRSEIRNVAEETITSNLTTSITQNNRYLRRIIQNMDEILKRVEL